MINIITPIIINTGINDIINPIIEATPMIMNRIVPSVIIHPPKNVHITSKIIHPYIIKFGIKFQMKSNGILTI